MRHHKNLLHRAVLLITTIILLFSCAAAETEAEKVFGIRIDEIPSDQLDQAAEELHILRDYIDELIEAVEQRIATESSTDYTSMALDQAIELAGLAAKNDVCSLRAYDAGYPEVIMLDVDMKPGDTSYVLSSAIRYCIHMTNALFQRNDVQMVDLKFWEPGRDKKGNAVDMMTITMRLRKTTAAQINMDYFYQYTAANQLKFLTAIDGYSMHKDYKAVAQ